MFIIFVVLWLRYVILISVMMEVIVSVIRIMFVVFGVIDVFEIRKFNENENYYLRFYVCWLLFWV